MTFSSHALTGIPKQAHAWSIGICVAATALCIVLFSVYKDRPVWDGFRESRELQKPIYGERIYRDSVFRTWANTWSNLAYVYVGIYVMVIGLFDLKQPAPEGSGHLRRRPALGLLYGLACCYLGIGSGIFHASLTHWGQQLDVAAMYSPLVALIALNLDRLRPAWPLWGMMAILASALLYIYKWSMSSSLVLPALILSVGFFMALDRFRHDYRMETRWILLAAASLLAAFLFRQLDVAGQFTGSDACLQGHVLWHCFTASALACAWLYYRSESVPARP